MTTKLLMISLIMCGLSSLSGCASLNANFDCPIKPGVMCESLDEVNTQVDQGLLGSNTHTPTCKSCHLIKANNMNRTIPYLNAQMNLDHPIRANETVMRMWMAPYEDKEGNYYEDAILYTVVKPGFWVGPPLKAMSSEGDAV